MSCCEQQKALGTYIHSDRYPTKVSIKCGIIPVIDPSKHSVNHVEQFHPRATTLEEKNRRLPGPPNFVVWTSVRELWHHHLQVLL